MITYGPPTTMDESECCDRLSDEAFGNYADPGQYAATPEDNDWWMQHLSYLQIAKDDDVVVGYSAVLPLTRSQGMDFCAGKITESQLVSDAMDNGPFATHVLYCMATVVTPEYRRRGIGKALRLSLLERFACKTVIIWVYSPFGEHIAKLLEEKGIEVLRKI